MHRSPHLLLVVQLLPHLGELLFDARHAARDGEIVNKEYRPDGDVCGEEAPEILHCRSPLNNPKTVLRIPCPGHRRGRACIDMLFDGEAQLFRMVAQALEFVALADEQDHEQRHHAAAIEKNFQHGGIEA